MTNHENPYASPRIVARSITERPRRERLWIIGGAILGSLVPVLFGAYSVWQFNNYVATLEAGARVCGTPALVALACIFLGGPIGAVVGALIGWACVAVRASRQGKETVRLSDET